MMVSGEKQEDTHLENCPTIDSVRSKTKKKLFLVISCREIVKILLFNFIIQYTFMFCLIYISSIWFAYTIRGIWFQTKI